MRELLSVLVAAVFIFLVVIIAVSGNMVLLDYWTAVAASFTIAALTVLFWGFKQRLISHFEESGKPKIARIGTPEIEVEFGSKGSAKSEKISEEEFRILCERKVNLLQEDKGPLKLSFSNDYLNQLYEQAMGQATKIHHDAKMSNLSIQVFPFEEFGSRVAIYFDFYSKTTNKISRFSSNEISGKMEHRPPLKKLKGYPDNVFIKLPWKKSPNWQDFLDRVYELENPIHKAQGSCYHLTAVAYDEKFPWGLKYIDDFGGNDFSYVWSGKGIDEKNIKKRDD